MVLRRRAAGGEAGDGGGAARPAPDVRSGRGARRLAVGTVAASVVLSAATAGAVVTFNDVPANSPFRDDIANVAGAGIARGYPDGDYHPTEPVSRQAMAAFLQRGLGRVGHSSRVTWVTTNSTQPDVTVTNVVVSAGAEGGGNGFVLLMASADAALESDDTSPRSINISITDVATGQKSTGAIETVGPTAYQYRSLTDQWVVPISAGQTKVFRLVADGVGFSDMIRVRGELTAVYVPFGPDGDSTLIYELPPPP